MIQVAFGGRTSRRARRATWGEGRERERGGEREGGAWPVRAKVLNALGNASAAVSDGSRGAWRRTRRRVDQCRVVMVAGEEAHFGAAAEAAGGRIPLQLERMR